MKSSLKVILVLLGGLFLAWAILKSDQAPDKTHEEKNHEDGEVDNQDERGPNGGWIFL